MRITEAIIYKEKPFVIPDCSRDELPKFFKAMDYKVGAEIGVYKGNFIKTFCWQGLKMYGIDPWIPYGGGGNAYNNVESQESLFNEASHKLRKFDCTLIRKTSRDALAHFIDNSLDFVYIDGDHRFQYVAEDIVEWSKKVRSGGVVSGHDYRCVDLEINKLPLVKQLHRHVGLIVDAYIDAFQIENFYVFGQSRKLNKNSKNESFLSWMFIKK